MPKIEIGQRWHWVYSNRNIFSDLILEVTLQGNLKVVQIIKGVSSDDVFDIDMDYLGRTFQYVDVDYFRTTEISQMTLLTGQDRIGHRP